MGTKKRRSLPSIVCSHHERDDMGTAKPNHGKDRPRVYPPFQRSHRILNIEGKILVSLTGRYFDKLHPIMLHTAR